MDDLVNQVRNADPDLLNDLVYALGDRINEVFPEFEMLVFLVEKKRTFEEQADEFIRFMERLKEIPEKRKTKLQTEKTNRPETK